MCDLNYICIWLASVEWSRNIYLELQDVVDVGTTLALVTNEMVFNVYTQLKLKCV